MGAPEHPDLDAVAQHQRVLLERRTVDLQQPAHAEVTARDGMALGLELGRDFRQPFAEFGDGGEMLAFALGDQRLGLAQVEPGQTGMQGQRAGRVEVERGRLGQPAGVGGQPLECPARQAEPDQLLEALRSQQPLRRRRDVQEVASTAATRAGY